MSTGFMGSFSHSGSMFTRNERDRLTGETDEEYKKRLRGISNRAHRTTHRTVAQDKRDAKKARNRRRSKGRA